MPYTSKVRCISFTKRLRFISLSTFVASLVIGGASVAYALSYNTDKPLAYTYQNSAGYWFAGGPVQFFIAGQDSEKEAFELVTQDRHRFSYKAMYGKCKVYVGAGKLESWDNSPGRTANRMEEKC